MDKRYQVFVSSTYEDLREARQEVMQALLELDCIPAGMELFPAANEDQWTLIKGVIDDCDYYIVVIGGRYGSVAQSGISYTEMEYEYALAQGKPVIAFLHKDPGSLPSNKCEATAEGRTRLDAFRTRVQQKMCRFWISPADLGSVVSRSLIKLIKNNPAVGWVRADLLPDQSATDEILRLQKRVEELQEKLGQDLGPASSGVVQLSQGEDEIALQYSFGLYKRGYFRPEYAYNSVFTTSWNALFSVVSPLLIDEASDRVLKEAIENFIRDENVDRHIANGIDNYDTEQHEIRGFSLYDDDFNTIKVQLLALRLISKSTKKKSRSVSDRNAYWTLTPHGEIVMMTLRAIRKESKSEPIKNGEV